MSIRSVPSLYEIAVECRSSRSPTGFLNSDQRDKQAELREGFQDFHPMSAHMSDIVIPFFQQRSSFDKWAEKRAAGAKHRDRRSMAVSNATGGGYLIGTEVPDIGLALADGSFLVQRGAQIGFGLSSATSYPASRATVTTEWMTEEAQATARMLNYRNLPLNPCRITARVPVSTQLLAQGSNVESHITSEAVAGIMGEVQRVMVAGRSNGVMAEPIGLLSTDGVAVVSGGTDGAAPTYDHLADLEYAVTGTGKADRGFTGWVTSPKVRRKLRKTRMSPESGEPLWPDSDAYRLLGHGASVANAVPDNLTKGTASEVCSAIVFGEWSEMFVGFFGPGIFVDPDPYTYADAGMINMIFTAYVDGGARHPEAFAVMKDALCNDS